MDRTQDPVWRKNGWLLLANAAIGAGKGVGCLIRLQSGIAPTDRPDCGQACAKSGQVMACAPATSITKMPELRPGLQAGRGGRLRGAGRNCVCACGAAPPSRAPSTISVAQVTRSEL